MTDSDTISFELYKMISATSIPILKTELIAKVREKLSLIVHTSRRKVERVFDELTNYEYLRYVPYEKIIILDRGINNFRVLSLADKNIARDYPTLRSDYE